MTDIFILVYRFFNSHKGVFYFLLVLLAVAIIFLSQKIRFEEDIARTLNKKGTDDLQGFVLKNLKLTDKLVVDILLSDSLARPDPEEMIQLGQRLVDSLHSRFDTAFIRNIVFQTSDSVIVSLMELVNDHLPSFLDEKDYQTIDSLINPGAVARSFEKNLRVLNTPASFFLRKRIQQDPLNISGLALKKMKSIQVDGNFNIVDGCVFSVDMRHLLLFIVPANPSSETSLNTTFIRGMDDIINGMRQGENQQYEIGYFGGVAVAVSNATQLKKDILRSLIIAFVLIFLLIGWYFRSILVPLLGLLPALFGGGLALAVLAVTIGSISAIALGIGSVILGLIVDYTLYLVNLYRKKGAMEAVLKEIALTLILCSLTSAGAFLCLTFLDSGVLSDLGWFAAISVLGAAFFALVVLPHFLPESIVTKPSAQKPNIIDRIAAIRFEKNIPLIFMLVLVLAVSLFFANRVTFEKEMNTLSFITPQLAKTEATLDKISDYKLKNIYFVTTGTSIEKTLRAKEKLVPAIQSLQKKGIVHAMNDAGPLLQSDSLQRIKIARWNSFWTPEKKARLQQTILNETKKSAFRPGTFEPFFHLLNKKFEPLPANNAELLENPIISDWISITPEKILAPLILRVTNENKPLVYSWFSSDPNIILFDKQNLTEQFVESVKHDFDLLVKLTMIFVTLLLIVSFGRLGLGLISAIPMYASWIITLGFMGITGIRFNIFNIIISSFIFGLGVDYSILIMRGLQHRYKTGQSDLKTYKVSVILSSATTIFGVGALFFARHPALHSIALISTVGISLVVILSFVVLPLIFDGIILSWDRRRFPVTLRILVKTLVTWGNIVLIAGIMMVFGTIINLLFFIKQKKKEMVFHTLFSWLTRAYIAFTFAFDRKTIKPSGEDFSTPAIIISNHQSLIETPAFLRLYPKILILTKTWVYRSPIFGPIARLANFFNVDQGVENLLAPLRKKVEEGYSILIFPEAHRSSDQKIQRFHRGAFYLAEKLQIDILPVLVFGSGEFLAKGAFWGKPNSFRMKILPRIKPDDRSFGATYQERARLLRRFYIANYESFKAEEGNAHYYRRLLALNYVLKGPILEWYMRVKMKLEDNYEIYNERMPRNGHILDLGCGYGFIAYMLMFTGENRYLTGVDHDEDKIAIATNCFSKNDRIRFFSADVTQYAITPHDGFLLNDLLHYLDPQDQETLLRSCFSNLNPGGTILIREANTELKQRHKKSVLTELFSTRSGFNKTKNPAHPLFFLSAKTLRTLAESCGMNMEIIDNKKVTSNNLFVIRHG